MTREEIVKELEIEMNNRTNTLDYIVADNQNKIIARFLRKSQAEKFIETEAKHSYHLIG